MSNQIDRVFVNGKWYVSDSARQFAQAQAVREAIAAERAKWSAFADEKGEPRKVDWRTEWPDGDTTIRLLGTREAAEAARGGGQ